MKQAGGDALPLTFLVPETSSEPTLIYDAHAALVMALADRHGILALGDEWNTAGIYILLDTPTGEGWSCYVGKAPAGMKSRIARHLTGKDHWSRALLIARDTTHGFNSAHVGWLEGRVYDLLAAAAAGSLHNSVRPSDETLPQYERSMLEACVLPISRVLRLLGYDTSPEDAPSVASRKANRYYGIELKQLLSAGLLAPESTVYSTNGAWPAQGVVHADGSVTVNGATYPTPSAAAASVKGGAANGWEFWAVDLPQGRTALATLRTLYLEGQAAT